MADGPRYLQQSTGPSFYNTHTSNSSVQNVALLQSLLGHFVANKPPSPSSPNRNHGSPSQTPQGMYNHNQQQGHNSRLTNNNPGQRMPIHYNFQQPSALQHQSHGQHHPSLQQEHSGQANNAGVLGHHSTFGSGVLSNASPFSANLPNGHSNSTRGGQAQAMTEHWAEQMKLYKVTERAHTAMIEENQPHYYARLKAPDNRAAPSNAGGAQTAAEGETEDRRRPVLVSAKAPKQQYWTNLDLSGQQIRSLSMKLFNYTFLQELYICSNKLSTLTPAIGELRQLRVLDASNNALTDLPQEIGMCTSLRQLLLFNNHIQTLPHELGSLHHLEQLGIEGNPLDPEIKNMIKEKGTAVLVKELLEKQPVPMPPLPRKSIVIQEDVSASLERIKVFSWNILCERYATESMYGYTPSGALQWEYRRTKIYQEIQERDADFLCLQEVTTEAFREDFSPELAKMDYKGVHFPRTKARLMNEREGLQVDGCAIFYKGSKFILLDKQIIEMSNIAINRADMKSQSDIFNRVMPKDNIAVLGFFESRRTGARMIVANAHLAWEGTLADVKIVQTAIIMEQITKFADKYTRWPACKDKKVIRMPNADDEDEEVVSGRKKDVLIEPAAPSQEYRNNTDIPLFVCGDYNSTKDSGVVELLSRGRLAPDHPELAGHEYGLFTRDGIEHPFSLRSAYQHLVGTPEEMPFTNYVPDFAHVIDYIWYSSNNLEVVELLGPPDSQHLKRVPGFPNYHFPADHIQIMAEFVIKARKDKKGGSGPSNS